MRYLTNLLSEFPAPYPESLLGKLAKRAKEEKRVTVILDDDPTGSQTVHDVHVITEWSLESLIREFNSGAPLFYILTNSRSVGESEACAIQKEIGERLLIASEKTGRDFQIISRSDSTLRGHFPAEVDAVLQATRQENMPILLIPFFEAGGRFTINDVHYLVKEGICTPVGETEFSRDLSFGYKASNLKDWVEQKTKGRIQAAQVASISLNELRCTDTLGIQALASRLKGFSSGTVIIVNAVCNRDLEVFAMAFSIANEQGARFIIRSAASIVPLLIGQNPIHPVADADLASLGGKGGLVVLGSYVPMSTKQLAHLLEHFSTSQQLEAIEVSVREILNPNVNIEEMVTKFTDRVDTALRQEKLVVLYSSRELISGLDAADSLKINSKVAYCLRTSIANIQVQPRYVIGKGGITSHEIAADSLGIRKALVMGQIIPGVPLWKSGKESRFPGLPYGVFPGNVGTEASLTQAVMRFESNNSRKPL